MLSAAPTPQRHAQRFFVLASINLMISFRASRNPVVLFLFYKQIAVCRGVSLCFMVGRRGRRPLQSICLRERYEPVRAE